METTYNAFGKVAETVDFGGEPDYTDFEWFKEPPPERPAVSLPRIAPMSCAHPLPLASLAHPPFPFRPLSPAS